MGVARGLIALVATLPLVAGAVCAPGAEGLVVTEAGGALQVAALAPNSPAALGGVVVGDVVLQVNGERPRSCGEWRSLVEDVRSREVVLLVLVRHGVRQRVVAVRAGEPAAVESPGERDRVAVVAAPPPQVVPTTTVPVELLPDAVPVTRADVVGMLTGLATARPAQLGAYREEVRHARQALSTLLVRDPGTADAEALLRLVRLHEAAAVAWEAVESIRARQGLRPSMPVSMGATETYFAGSEVAGLIDEIPALTKTVRQAPRSARVEIAGRWEPMRARQLLWAEADVATSALVGADSRD